MLLLSLISLFSFISNILCNFPIYFSHSQWVLIVYVLVNINCYPETFWQFWQYAHRCSFLALRQTNLLRTVSSKVLRHKQEVAATAPQRHNHLSKARLSVNALFNHIHIFINTTATLVGTTSYSLLARSIDGETYFVLWAGDICRRVCYQLITLHLTLWNSNIIWQMEKNMIWCISSVNWDVNHFIGYKSCRNWLQTRISVVIGR